MILLRHMDSPLGGITLAGEGDCLIGLWIDGQTHFASTLTGEPAEGWLPVFGDASRWLDTYFSGYQPDFVPPYRIDGLTPFRRAVTDAMLAIPFGETATYGGIAAAIARQRGIPRMSAQAVGGAVGWNPLCIIVPCHRVVGAARALTGYGGGIRNKIALQRLEGHDI